MAHWIKKLKYTDLINMENELLKRIQTSDIYEGLREYLAAKIIELQSLDGLEALPNDLAGEEAKVRLKAQSKLQEILGTLLQPQKKEAPTELDIEKAKKKYLL